MENYYYHIEDGKRKHQLLSSITSNHTIHVNNTSESVCHHTSKTTSFINHLKSNNNHTLSEYDQQEYSRRSFVFVCIGCILLISIYVGSIVVLAFRARTDDSIKSYMKIVETITVSISWISNVTILVIYSASSLFRSSCLRHTTSLVVTDLCLRSVRLYMLVAIRVEDSNVDVCKAIAFFYYWFHMASILWYIVIAYHLNKSLYALNMRKENTATSCLTKTFPFIMVWAVSLGMNLFLSISYLASGVSIQRDVHEPCAFSDPFRPFWLFSILPIFVFVSEVYLYLPFFFHTWKLYPSNARSRWWTLIVLFLCLFTSTHLFRAIRFLFKYYQIQATHIIRMIDLSIWELQGLFNCCLIILNYFYRFTLGEGSDIDLKILARDHIELDNYYCVYQKEGCFKIYKAQWKSCLINVKIYDSDIDSNDIEKYKVASFHLSKLNHPNITFLIGIAQISKSFALALEPVQHTLDEVLQDEWAFNSYEDILRIALHIGSALAYLHSQRPCIIHQNLSPTSIYIDGTGTAKLGDFELSQTLVLVHQCASMFYVKHQTWIVDQQYSVEQDSSTIEYTPPEHFGDEINPETASKADIYSFGITLWQMFTREKPYELIVNEKKWNHRQLGEEIAKGLRPKIPSTCPSFFSHLIETCWDGNPANRLTATDIVNGLRCEYRHIREENLSARRRLQFERIGFGNDRDRNGNNNRDGNSRDENDRDENDRDENDRDHN